MIYKNLREVKQDYRYGSHLDDYEDDSYHGLFGPTIPYDQKRKLFRLWKKHMQEKYEETKKSNSRIGRFLQTYILSLKELMVLAELIEDNDSIFSSGNNGVFEKYNMSFFRSQLRKQKIVFNIINPLKPMEEHFEVSYKAQMLLAGRPYTEEYKQLDMELEDRSKRSSPDELDNLYYLLKPTQKFTDLIASDKLHTDLKTAVARENNKNIIFDEWGIRKKINYGIGTTINFRGPPGTGKTLAAHCLAKELKRPLLLVRYDQMQSMYIGETEKHVQRIFQIAKIKNAVLFFDEADAIALDRSSLSKSWEMSTVNTLLKELERYEGMCIFATNFSEKYDKAFERRLTMHIDFERPSAKNQKKILLKLFPKKALGSVDINSLKLEGLTGGDIKNVVLNAAGVAARDNSLKIEQKHIQEALDMMQKAEIKTKVSYCG